MNTLLVFFFLPQLFYLAWLLLCARYCIEYGVGGFEKLFIFKEHVTFVGLLFSQLFFDVAWFYFYCCGAMVLWCYEIDPTWLLRF